MASQTEIANRAAVKMGEDRIINIDDNNKVARTLKSMFNIVRDAELRKRRWSFSIKRVQLAADVAAPAFGYGAQYQLPVDCLRPLTIALYDFGADLSDYHGGGKPYVIEGRKILYGSAGAPAPSGALPLRYIASIEDTTLWDACFVEAFACKLAVEACETLAQSSDKRRLAWQEYKDAIAEAVRANAIELPAESIPDDTWIMGRLSG